MDCFNLFKQGTFLVSLTASVAIASNGEIPINGTVSNSTNGSQLDRPMVSVNPSADKGSLTPVIFPGAISRTDTTNLYLKIKNSCFGTNLRSVSNPLARSANIIANVEISLGSRGTQTMTVTYPSSVASGGGQTGVSQIPGTLVNNNGGGLRPIVAAFKGNVINSELPIPISANINADGQIIVDDNPTITRVTFLQDVAPVESTQPPYPRFNAQMNTICGGVSNCSYASPYDSMRTLKKVLPFKFYSYDPDIFFGSHPIVTMADVNTWDAYNAAYNTWYRWFNDTIMREAKGKGAYMGTDGPVTAVVSALRSVDGKTFELSAAFPGENGFCGGYFSPLMVFFDNKRPKFTAEVGFPLNPSGRTLWPEKGAPGYFIAYDRNKDNKISEANELFGSEGGAFKNGFEALREFDSNGDGVIDEKDLRFHDLLLWSDKNSNGKSEKDELTKLSDKVKSISLDYNDKDRTSFGVRAEVREASSIVFVDSKGKEKIGAVIDVWFTAPN